MKKSDKRKIDAFRKKLMIPESASSECPEYSVKSKIGNKFPNEKTREEYCVRIYEIDPFFMRIKRKK